MRFALFSSLTLFLALLGGCESRGLRADVPAESASSAAPVVVPAVVAADGPTVTSRVEVPGLRVTSGTVGPAAAWGFSELAVDLRVVRLQAVALSGPRQLSQMLPPGALAVLNGGYFEADFRPSAWLVSGGVEQGKQSGTKKGGVLAVSASHEAFVGPMASLTFAPEFALQSFPLVVESGGVPGILRDDGKRAARNVACLVAGELHFVLIAAPRGDGPTLFESMALLRDAPPRGFGCTAALNLDGGPSVGVVFAPNIDARPRLPLAPIGYGIAIVNP